MGDGTLRLERRWTALAGTGGALLSGANETWTTAIDGIAVGAVAPKKTVEVAVEAGHHTLLARAGQTPEPGAVVRRCPGRGRQLLLPRSQVRLAKPPCGTRQTRPLDFAQAAVSWFRRARQAQARALGARGTLRLVKIDLMVVAATWCPSL
jgi:hypothetical protein